MLAWTVPKLAKMAGVGTDTIYRFEHERQETKPETIAKIASALGDAVERVRSGEVKMELTPVECRAARVLLGWSLAYLAGRAGVRKQTVHRFERGQEMQKAKLATIVKLRQALEDGVEFGGDGWLRLRVAEAGGASSE